MVPGIPPSINPPAALLRRQEFFNEKELGQIIQIDLQLPFFHELQLWQIRFDHLPRPRTDANCQIWIFEEVITITWHSPL